VKRDISLIALIVMWVIGLSLTAIELLKVSP
jgi:hypothetical protein